MREFITR